MRIKSSYYLRCSAHVSSRQEQANTREVVNCFRSPENVKMGLEYELNLHISSIGVHEITWYCRTVPLVVEWKSLIKYIFVRRNKKKLCTHQILAQRSRPTKYFNLSLVTLSSYSLRCFALVQVSTMEFIANRGSLYTISSADEHILSSF
jgi:hypothetical protein